MRIADVIATTIGGYVVAYAGAAFVAKDFDWFREMYWRGDGLDRFMLLYFLAIVPFIAVMVLRMIEMNRREARRRL